MLSAQAVRVVGQMGTLIVLARLLPPSAFGLLAMVGAIGLILDLVKEFGLSAATIQKHNITQAQVSALFWINSSVGAVLGAGLFLAAPLLAQFYDQPELVDVARWMSLAFVASGGLFVAPDRSGRPRLATTLAATSAPSWSANGENIAAAVRGPGGWSVLAVAQRDGWGVTTFSSPSPALPEIVGPPVWRPR